jgi:hypothetical protein
VVSFHSVFLPNSCIYIISASYVPHSLPISFFLILQCLCYMKISEWNKTKTWREQKTLIILKWGLKPWRKNVKWAYLPYDMDKPWRHLFMVTNLFILQLFCVFMLHWTTLSVSHLWQDSFIRWQVNNGLHCMACGKACNENRSWDREWTQDFRIFKQVRQPIYCEIP